MRDHAFHAYPKRKMGRAIRTDRYRLVQWLGENESIDKAEYELYDYQTDPLEKRNLADANPAVVERLKRILAQYPDPVSRARSGRKSSQRKGQPNLKVATPEIANRSLRVLVEVSEVEGDGVMVAQGGREHGYAIHRVGNRVAFDVRVNGVVTRILSDATLLKEGEIEAVLNAKLMTLSLNGRLVARGESPGLIPVQPKDELSIGYDEQSAAGNYTAPNEFNGIVKSLAIESP